MHTGLPRRSSLAVRAPLGAIALTAATSLVLAQTPSAWAATDRGVPLSLTVRTAGPAAPASEIERLYVEGQDQYGAGDFAAAADSWTRLLEGLPEASANKATRENVLLNIVQADLDAYNRTRKDDGSKNIEHLRAGKQTLERYYTDYRRAYGDRASVSAAVQQKGDELEALLEEAEREAAAKPAPIGDPPPDDPPVDPTRQPGPAPTKEVIVLKPQSAGSGLIVGGAIAAAVGVGMVGLGIAGGVLGPRAERDVKNAGNREEEDAARKRGNAANAMMISGLVTGAVGLGTGAVLLVLGIKRRQAADAAAADAVSVAPAIGPHFSGVALSGRF